MSAESTAPAPSPMIFSAMSKVMAEIGAVEKSRRNEHFKYSFRGIDEMLCAAQPAMVKAGVFFVSEILDEHREDVKTNSGTAHGVRLRIRFRFYAADGSFVEAVTIGEAIDSSDKATNKAMSAALKYALIMTFCVPTEGDNDTENSTQTVESRKPAPKTSPPGVLQGAKAQRQQTATGVQIGKSSGHGGPPGEYRAKRCPMENGAGRCTLVADHKGECGPFSGLIAVERSGPATLPRDREPGEDDDADNLDVDLMEMLAHIAASQVESDLVDQKPALKSLKERLLKAGRQAGVDRLTAAYKERFAAVTGAKGQPMPGWAQ